VNTKSGGSSLFGLIMILTLIGIALLGGGTYMGL
jgi:hypothetical protein